MSSHDRSSLFMSLDYGSHSVENPTASQWISPVSVLALKLEVERNYFKVRNSVWNSSTIQCSDAKISRD